MNNKLRTLSGIARYAKPYALVFAFAVLLYSGQGFGFSLIGSLFMRNLSAAMLAADAAAVWAASITYIATLACFMAILGLGVVLYVRYNELITRDLKHDLFGAFVTASIEDRGHSGEGIASINTEANMACALFDNAMCSLVGCLISILFSSIAIFAVSPALGLVSLGIGGLALLLQARFSAPLERIANDRLDANASAVKRLTGLFGGGAGIRMFGLQRKVLSAFGEDNDQMLALSYKEAVVSMWRDLFTTLQGWLTLAGIFGIGGYLVASGRLALPALLMIPNLCMNLAYGMGNIGAAWAGIQAPLAAGERVLATLETGRRAQRIADRKRALARPYDGGRDLALDHLRFRYLGAERDALQGISLDIPHGTMVAFVGESGSGKSTLLRAIIGLYEREELSMRLGDMHFSRTPAADWRTHFAYVDQSCTLFDMTIAENIALGKEGATRQEVEEAAMAAQADGFIRALPQGYDTRCGERGASLSGGQRQRIAIARALVRKAPILAFDEATASLDAEAERQIMQTIQELRAGHTILITSHNLAAIRGADAIVAIKDGTIAQIGTHDQLLAEGGEYARLWLSKKS